MKRVVGEMLLSKTLLVKCMELLVLALSWKRRVQVGVGVKPGSLVILWETYKQGQHVRLGKLSAGAVSGMG